jgi:hypothetical protein
VLERFVLALREGYAMYVFTMVLLVFVRAMVLLVFVWPFALSLSLSLSLSSLGFLGLLGVSWNILEVKVRVL